MAQKKQQRKKYSKQEKYEYYFKRSKDPKISEHKRQYARERFFFLSPDISAEHKMVYPILTSKGIKRPNRKDYENVLQSIYKKHKNEKRIYL